MTLIKPPFYGQYSFVRSGTSSTLNVYRTLLDRPEKNYTVTVDICDRYQQLEIFSGVNLVPTSFLSLFTIEPPVFSTKLNS